MQINTTYINPLQKLKLFIIIVVLIGFKQKSFSQTQESYMMAQQFYMNGEYEKAKNIYEKLIQNKQYKEIIFDNYVNTLLKLKEYNEAEKNIKRAIRESPENYSRKIILGQLYLEKGDNKDAEKIFNDIIKELPQDVFKIGQIANHFYRINNFDYAIKTFLNGRKVLNNQQQFSLELINLYRYMRIKDGLVEELINVLDTRSDYLPAAKSNISRTFETDEDYQMLKSVLLKTVQKAPQNINFNDLLAWTYIQLKEYDMALIQTIAMDKRTNDNGAKVFSLAEIMKDDKAFGSAERAYNYVIEKGNHFPYYINSRVELLKVKQYQLNAQQNTQSDASYLENAYQQLLNEFGKNAHTLFAIKELAKLKANVLNKSEEAEKLLEEALELRGVSADEIALLKLELADIYTLNNNPWDASLLLSQVEKSHPNTPIGQDAKFRNARLSFYNGDFNWAKAQLDVLKASTSQLIANDALDLSLLIQDHLMQDSTGAALKLYARAEFLRHKNQFENTLLLLDSILLKYPDTDLTDDILLSKARIFTAQKKYDAAVLAYQKIIAHHSSGIWADDALYSLAVLYEDILKDTNRAKVYYQQLINDFTGSLFVNDARKRLRNIRGDNL